MISRRALELRRRSSPELRRRPSSSRASTTASAGRARGVDAGTFPFLTGVIIVARQPLQSGTGRLAGHACTCRHRGHAIELRRLAGLFVPAAIFVGVDSAARDVSRLGLLCLRARWRSRDTNRVLRALSIAAATALALYVVFERLFQVTLPHGALAAALGF